MRQPDSTIARLSRRSLLGGAFVAAAVLPTGCAKVPSSGSLAGQRLLKVHLAVRGALTPVNATTGATNYYFVCINLTNNANAFGPVPQISPAYSNGIATTTDTSNTIDNTGMVGFVQYGGTLQTPTLFQAPADTTLNWYQSATSTRYTQYTNLGQVESFTVGASTLDFQVILNRLLLSTITTLPSYLQINIITTDSVPSGSAVDAQKLWDAMGDGTSVTNTYLTLSTVQSGQTVTSQDGRTTDEPSATSDVRDRNNPGAVTNDSLDLTSWTIQLL